MRFKSYLKILWAGTLVLNIYLRWSFCKIAAWSSESVGISWLGALYAHQGVFPDLSISSSVGVYNFNGIPLFMSVLYHLPGGFFFLSVLFTVIQLVLILLLINKLTCLSAWSKWLTACAILFNPFVTGLSLDIWTPYFTGHLICFIVYLLITAFRKRQAGLWWWLIMGMVLSWLPALYLGNIAVVVTTLTLIVYGLLKRFIRFSWSAAGVVLLSILPVIFLSVVPYLSALWETDVFKHFGSVESPPRNLDHIFKAISYPWWLMVNPRHFYPYSSEVVLGISQVKAASFAIPGRFYDTELMMNYGLKNINQRLSEPLFQSSEFLVTYNFVKANELPPSWRDVSNYKDFGRLRVYRKLQ